MPAITKPTPSARQFTWLWILCLVGLDYFSSLAYQPSLAFEAAGWLAPLATVVVVIATLLGALPIYFYIAGRSPHGQGAIGMLERSIPGWRGKLLIVTLLGFAATDFVMTRTLSVADAAEHLIFNPHPWWQKALHALSHIDDAARRWSASPLWQRMVGYWNQQLVVTIVLSILGFIFWAMFRNGFTRRVVRLSIAVVTVYLLLNTVIIGSSLAYLASRPELREAWWAKLSHGYWHPQAGPVSPGSWWLLGLLCLFVFPKLALGLSGFELSMVVMPLVRGNPTDPQSEPGSRIRNARKLLLTAALLMSLFLLGSTLVTTTLIPAKALTTEGQAANRALAYLAHGGPLTDGERATRINPYFGELFGTAYDLSTILILCLAGASVAIGLRDFVPGYLHRLGMELNWAHKVGVSLYIFNGINLVVTVIFRASVTAQRGAYATSVLVLLSSATVAAVLEVWRRRTGSWIRRMPWGFLLISAFFHAATLVVIISKPDGLLIALCFVAAILTTSVLSRALRATELRCEGLEFKDAKSQFLWQSLVYLEFPVLVPHRPGQRTLGAKEELIRRKHHLPPEMPVVFLEAELGDASNFYHKPLITVLEEQGRFVIRVDRCHSVPHVIAAVALELSKVGKPPEIHFGWSEESPVEANVDFLLFGRGNVPWMVHDLIRKAEPDPARRPDVIIG
jgi:hypothetical protein